MSPARHLSELNRTEGSVLSLDGDPRAVVSEERFDDRSQQHAAPWRFRNWRVRTKIIAILLIPLMAVVALSGLRLSGVLSDMQQASRAEQVAGLALDAAALADELQAERDLSGAYVGRSRSYGEKELHTERGRVDRAVRDYQQAEDAMTGDYGPVVTDLVASVDKHIQQLTQVRQAIDRGVAPWSAMFDDYTRFVSDLVSIEEAVPQGSNDARLTDGVRAMASLSRVKALLSAERGSLDYVLGSNRFDDQQFRDFLNLDARLHAAQEEFQASITAAQRAQYESKVTGVVTSPVDSLTKQAMTSPSGALSIDLADWYAKVSAVVQKMRVVEVTFGNQVLDRASQMHQDAQRQAAVNTGVVLVVLLVTFVLALMVARSLVRPLRRLRSTATEVALHRLPQSVNRLRSTTAVDLDAEVEPIGITSTDEVGDLATAFDVVHREAVRIAVEQALLRRNVSTMFVNLSRRTQSLVERQLRLIDDLEVNEENTDSLGNLFQLDHLATRMRRNAENLLVLAGADSGRRWSNPVALIDVLRAAAAEVEQYPRVAQTYVTAREIDGRAVGDVVHLVAEMLENALEFSSPETQVVVSGRSLSGDAGVMVEIEDRGIGMSADELATANERLATAAEIDVGLSRMMGLYVVGKLAARHSISVQLRHAATGGVLAQIHLPGSIVTGRMDGPDEMEPRLAPRAAEGPVPVTAGAPAVTELADLGDHETRPIIVERTRTRPRPLSRPEDDHDGPQAFHDGPGGRSGEFPLPTRSSQLPVDRGGPGGPPQRDSGSTTGTFRMPPGLPPGGEPVGSGSARDRAEVAPPVPELPEFDFGMDLDNVLSGGVGSALQDPDGGQTAEDRTPDDWEHDDPEPTAQDGSGLTAAGLPRRDAVGRENPQSDLFPAETSQTRLPTLGQSSPGQPAPTRVPEPMTPAAVPAPPQGQPDLPAAPVASGRPDPLTPAEQGRPAADTSNSTGKKGPEEYLPIYAQVESEWFRRRTRPVAAGADRQPATRPSWESVADAGWRAAEQIAKPRVSGTTRAGLPIRQPQAHYVPGSAGPGPRATIPDGVGPAARRQNPQDSGQVGVHPGPTTGGRPGTGSANVRSPEAVRGLLSNYHRGLRQGREAGHQQVADGDEFRTE